MGWQEVSTPGITLTDSPSETRTFGFETARLTVGSGTQPEQSAIFLECLVEALQKNKLVITRWASECNWVPSLLHAPSFRLIPNTTLVYWSIDLTSENPPDPKPLVSPDPDSDLVAKLISEIFLDYPSHYETNPHLPAGITTQAYTNWARELESDPLARFFVIETGAQVAAGVGLTLDLHQAKTITEVLVAGVAPEHQKQGLYGPLMGSMCDSARDHGSTQLVISTQANNYAVQKAWIRAGLKPILAVDGCHIISETISG